MDRFTYCEKCGLPGRLVGRIDGIAGHRDADDSARRARRDGKARALCDASSTLGNFYHADAASRFHTASTNRLSVRACVPAVVLRWPLLRQETRAIRRGSSLSGLEPT